MAQFLAKHKINEYDLESERDELLTEVNDLQAEIDESGANTKDAQNKGIGYW